MCQEAIVFQHQESVNIFLNDLTQNLHDFSINLIRINEKKLLSCLIIGMKNTNGH